MKQASFQNAESFEKFIIPILINNKVTIGLSETGKAKTLIQCLKNDKRCLPMNFYCEHSDDEIKKCDCPYRTPELLLETIKKEGKSIDKYIRVKESTFSVLPQKLIEIEKALYTIEVNSTFNEKLLTFTFFANNLEYNYKINNIILDDDTQKMLFTWIEKIKQNLEQEKWVYSNDINNMKKEVIKIKPINVFDLNYNEVIRDYYDRHFKFSSISKANEYKKIPISEKASLYIDEVYNEQKIKFPFDDYVQGFISEYEKTKELTKFQVGKAILYFDIPLYSIKYDNKNEPINYFDSEKAFEYGEQMAKCFKAWEQIIDDMPTYELLFKVDSNKKENIQNKYIEYLTDYEYNLIVYLNDKYETTKKPTKFSSIYHFLKYNDLLKCTQLEYIKIIKKEYGLKLSKITSTTYKYRDTIQPKLSRFKKDFDKEYKIEQN